MRLSLSAAAALAALVALALVLGFQLGFFDGH
jgi:hypothetical protein